MRHQRIHDAARRRADELRADAMDAAWEAAATLLRAVKRVVFRALALCGLPRTMEA
jgi:hypothetical protein